MKNEKDRHEMPAQREYFAHDLNVSLSPVSIQNDCILANDVLLAIAKEVIDEIKRAADKHGSQAMASPDLDTVARLPILVEEVGEVARAMTYDEGSIANLREELVQTAAMAMAWVHAIDINIQNEDGS